MSRLQAILLICVKNKNKNNILIYIMENSFRSVLRTGPVLKPENEVFIL